MSFQICGQLMIARLNASMLLQIFTYVHLFNSFFSVERLCNFFSHEGDSCFLLIFCDTISECEGCISGPPFPSLGECQAATSNSNTTTIENQGFPLND